MIHPLPLKVGDSSSFSKTISESDVYLFAGITGDFSQVHTNEEFMKGTPFGTRLAHGMLSMSLTSTTATLIQVQCKAPFPSLAYGYDKTRFIKPVYIGDTLTATYTIVETDQASMKTFANCEVHNQKGELVTVARHILKFLPPA